MVEDKFIMLDLDDENSKHIAEVIGNKTCKKIIDYLTDKKESSETEISESLKIPINTAEYNLNKLIRAGLIVKTKNFFWSVKGKKIDLYRLSRKHIIISPCKRPSIKSLNSIVPVLAGFLILAVLCILFYNNAGLENERDLSSVNLGDSDSGLKFEEELNKLETQAEQEVYVIANNQLYVLEIEGNERVDIVGQLDLEQVQGFKSDIETKNMLIFNNNSLNEEEIKKEVSDILFP